MYDSVGFVKKNADKLYDNLEDLMQEAENKLVCEAFGGGVRRFGGMTSLSKVTDFCFKVSIK